MKIFKILTTLGLMLVTSLAMAATDNTEFFYTALIGFVAMMMILLLQLPMLLTIGFMNNSVKPYQDLPQGKKYAGFWRRFAAGTVDSLILFCIFFVLKLIDRHTSLTQKHLFLGWILSFAKITTHWFYIVLFQGSRYKATPGMLLMKFKVYDEIMGKVGFWRLTGRYWSTLSVIVMVLIAPTIAFTKRKQGMHDMIARTVCVNN
jgi:uncharacterized RDD family membrane protein YckC